MKNHTKLTTREVGRFRRIVYRHYRHHGRDLPWRQTDNPYEILVSEIMLQQTQVSRVVEKYETFIRTFPDIGSLAGASLRAVLTAWQGLGYNRRALSLKNIAKGVMSDYSGQIPSTVSLLTLLPGIGTATAHAICAFAYNQPVVFIETNIRTVFIYHFFDERKNVHDGEIRPFVAQKLDRKNPRQWYNALMDYGVALKKAHRNPGRRSASHRKQAPFEGSARQVRGTVLRVVLKRTPLSFDKLVASVPYDNETVRQSVIQLEREGLVIINGKNITVP